LGGNKQLKKIILHIGYNKTGTTAIQSIFFYNRKSLMNDGLFYPVRCRGKRKSPAHHSLAESLIYQIGKPLPKFVKTKIYSKFPKYHYWQLLLEELAETDCKTIFISSEAFSRLRGHPEQMQFIRGQLKAYQVKILVYLRSQPDFLASAYNQAVKRGHETRTVDELMQSGWMTIDYFTELEDWASVFGAENIIVCIFDQQKMPGGVMADVVGVLEYEGIRLDTSIRASKFFSFKWNIRLPDNMVETKRRINAAYRLPEFADRAVNTWLQWRGKSKPNAEILTKAQKEMIIQRYSQSNQKLGEKYLNGKLPFIE
jgi:hypothetical protein